MKSVKVLLFICFKILKRKLKTSCVFVIVQNYSSTTPVSSWPSVPAVWLISIMSVTKWIFIGKISWLVNQHKSCERLFKEINRINRIV